MIWPWIVFGIGCLFLLFSSRKDAFRSLLMWCVSWFLGMIVSFFIVRFLTGGDDREIDNDGVKALARFLFVGCSCIIALCFSNEGEFQ